ARRAVNSGDEIQKRRFSRSRRSHEREEIAARHIERDAIENGNRECIALVDFVNVVNANECVHKNLYSPNFTNCPSLISSNFSLTMRSPARKPLLISRRLSRVSPVVTLRNFTFLSASITATRPSCTAVNGNQIFAGSC